MWRHLTGYSCMDLEIITVYGGSRCAEDVFFFVLVGTMISIVIEVMRYMQYRCWWHY